MLDINTCQSYNLRVLKMYTKPTDILDACFDCGILQYIVNQLTNVDLTIYLFI